MAKVPDLFEDLKDCYSENEEYSSAIDHFSLNQKSFYDASYAPLHENCMDKFVSLSTSETSKASKLTFEESLVVVATSASGKILKKRRLDLNETITDDNLETIIKDPEEETIKPRSALQAFQSNVRYKYLRNIKQQFVLNDGIHQSIIQDTSGQYLKATALTDLQYEVKFDMGGYSSSVDYGLPVTLRISKTRLFVTAQDENQPVLLKELPKTPTIITDSEANLIFFWENQGTKNYFRSAVDPELLIATKEESLVHMARGLPSIIDFHIP